MEVKLKEVKGVSLFRGAGFAKNLYNLNDGKKVTKWFNSSKKEELLNTTDEKYLEYFNNNLY